MSILLFSSHALASVKKNIFLFSVTSVIGIASIGLIRNLPLLLRIQILAQRPAIMTEVFRGFLQSLQVNAGTVH
jgi:hypothetical protein